MQALGKHSIASIVRGGLGVAWIASWLFAAATVLALLGYVIALIMSSVGGVDPQWLHDMSQQIRLRNGSIENYNGPGWLPVFGTFALAGVGAGGALVVIWRLRKMFDNFRSGEPFRRENADHLRVIWITMLIVEISRLALLALLGLLIRILGGPGVTGHSGGGEFNLMTWASILILIVLSEIFREGARLKEEQELTI